MPHFRLHRLRAEYPDIQRAVDAPAVAKAGRDEERQFEVAPVRLPVANRERKMKGKILPIPWDDIAVASIDHDGARTVIAEGTLRTVIATLAQATASEKLRIVLAFPDRRAPPYRMSGEDIGPLLMQIEIEERVAGRLATQSPAG